MHTIEATILVPLGLGLIVLLMMLTFFLHDQTVLTAEYASTMLEWQMSPGAWDRQECVEEEKQWGEMLLITEVHPRKVSAGKVLFAMETEEDYRLFDRALALLELDFSEQQKLNQKISVKVNPCWLKRIWKVVE